MKTLKDKETEWFFLLKSDEGLNNEVITGFYSQDVKEHMLDFNIFSETILKENSIMGLSDEDKEIILRIMDKYNIEPVERKTNPYKHILYVHKKIFGDFEK